MTTNKTPLRRLIAGAGALALALGGAAAAFGAPGPDQPGGLDKGTLTINKYSGEPRDNPSPDDLLSGVEFTVTQVGRTVGDDCVPVDLTVAAQWDGLEALFDTAPAEPTEPFCLLPSLPAQDTENGSTTFDLAVGVYYVEETDPGENNIVSPVPNFYVSIPTSLGEGGDGWNYNIVADPKNQLMDAPSKAIDEDQKDFVIGDNVTWPLTVPIPTLNNDELFTSATVTDALDSRLSYVSSTVSIGDTELLEERDYTVDEDGVTWTFTQTGRLLLDDNMGGDISIELITSVDEVVSGIIENRDYESEFNGTTVPGEVVPYTYWGQLSILKHDDSGTETRDPLPLEGAEFQVFELIGEACSTDVPEQDPIATGTSGNDGIVIWEDVDPDDVLGLWVDNSEDGPLTDPKNTYCVYETVVPAGHTAVPFDPAVEISPGVDATLALDVENARKDGPDLPLTGGSGTIALMTSGIVLFGAGMAVMIVARRRRVMAS